MGATDKLANSILVMEQFKHFQQKDKLDRTKDETIDLQSANQDLRSSQGAADSVKDSQKERNLASEALSSNFTRKEAPGYTRVERQNDIEQRVMAQLGDRFHHGQLLEISENSYLITGGVRLPVFGK